MWLKVGNNIINLDRVTRINCERHFVFFHGDRLEPQPGQNVDVNADVIDWIESTNAVEAERLFNRIIEKVGSTISVD
jgi:hypothetical protein